MSGVPDAADARQTAAFGSPGVRADSYSHAAAEIHSMKLLAGSKLNVVRNTASWASDSPGRTPEH